MKNLTATLFALTATLLTATALADGITIRRGQFTDRVERGAPVTAAAELPPTGRLVYWVEAANAGDAGQITLVWRVGGREVSRQSLDVGRGPRWRTWGVLLRRRAGNVEVQVLDAAGQVIHSDRLGGS
ncbi:MAG: DUF2914 domain-containing protein [Polyangiales bacterium]